MSKHDKFKAYWESLNKRQTEYRYPGDPAFVATAGDPTWDEAAEYRMTDDRHWRLRGAWVDSDFTLPIESFGEGAWFLCKTPCWMDNSEYRRAAITHELDESFGMKVEMADEGDGAVFWQQALKNAKPRASVDKTASWVRKLRLSELHDVVEVPTEGEYGINHPMYAIFMDAIEQATGGKGVRHGGAATPFFEQPWSCIAKHTGFRGLVFQMVKKAQEACGKDDMETFERELLGSLVYGAMALIHARKHGYTKQVKV